MPRGPATFRGPAGPTVNIFNMRYERALYKRALYERARNRSAQGPDFTRWPCLDGKVPTYVRRTLFGGTLLALAKKGGGVRPIAVGYVWRRLAAKVACNHVSERGADLLAPIQLGFGISGGVVAAVHAARRFASSLQPGKLLLKM